MNDDENKSADPQFLSRWSRLKQEAREQPPAAAPAVHAAAPVPDLPPVDQLTIESDFSGFLHPKVGENLRRAALKKLFSDPHFNVMDGLDTYVDDYSQPNPLPATMLAGLRQAQNILAWAQETKEETAARFATPPLENKSPSTTAQTASPADAVEDLPTADSSAEGEVAATELAATEPAATGRNS